jgi:CO/xanthine dehydrogenase Mo-binding subunit
MGALRSVGVSRPRIDGVGRVTGSTRYAADEPVPGLLHARIVGSPYAHARIVGIDVADAVALPGVVAVLTAPDLPTLRGKRRWFEPLARDEAVFAGQPIALVVARTETIAEDAAGLVGLDLDPLEPVVDVHAAMRPGAALARLAAAGDDPGDGNVFDRVDERRGDAGSILAASDVVVGGTFRSAWAYQGYLEPHAATAWIEPDGGVRLVTSTQSTFETRDAIATVYGLPTSKVRVTAAPLGGAFGSKQVVIEPLVVGAALRLRAPVRLALTRSEDMAATNPAQSLEVDLRIGASRSGQFSAVAGTLIFDGGAFPDHSWQWYTASLAMGHYRWPAADVEGVGVRTNRFPTGNYRAPSGPQGVFALESLVDELAGRLGIDPIDLRLANLANPGEPKPDGTPWEPTGFREVLERLRAHPLWAGRDRLPPGEGVGVASAVWHGAKQPAAATCRVERDGSITVTTGVVDMSGNATAFAAIAADTFGVPFDAVTVVFADSVSGPPAPPSNASAITYAVGPAIEAAVAEARDRLLDVAADELEIRAEDLEIVDGVVRPRGSPSAGRTVAELAGDLSETFNSPYAPLEGHASVAHRSFAPAAIGALAHVRLDPETGAVAVLAYVAVQDVGFAINPALVEGQLHGGSAQSIGRALVEGLVHDGQGQLLTGTLLDYALPKAPMVPDLDVSWIEVPAPEGPFGAKGMAEAPILPGPAAIANAIVAAGGPRMRELPMTAQRVWDASRAANRGDR